MHFTNGVYATCPSCGFYSYMRIPNVTMSFGEFYLDQPDTMLFLSEKQLLELREIVDGLAFRCENNLCSKDVFFFFRNPMEEKRNFILELFDRDTHANTNAHTEHCCEMHGCKYGDENCPVESGLQKQSYPCEICGDNGEE